MSASAATMTLRSMMMRSTTTGAAVSLSSRLSQSAARSFHTVASKSCTAPLIRRSALITRPEIATKLQTRSYYNRRGHEQQQPQQQQSRHYDDDDEYTVPAHQYNYHPRVRSTTILTVRKGTDCVVIGDGQMSAGSTVAKDNVRKVRLLGAENNHVIVGFAGSTADCMTLFDHLEKKLSEFPGQLLRAAVELAKMWRTDKMLRHLNASIIAVDAHGCSLQLNGVGDVISDEAEGIITIGSGGEFARAAARALLTECSGFHHELTARQVAIRAMSIAGDVCVYTNKNFVIQQFSNGKLVTGEEKLALEKQDKILMSELDEWRDARKLLQQQRQIESAKAEPQQVSTPASATAPASTSSGAPATEAQPADKPKEAETK